jgi:hypothetical protein
MRHGEYYMKIRYIKKILLLFGYPLFSAFALTRRTMSVAARMVDVL